LNFTGSNLKELIECFCVLMSDTEAEVRGASCVGLSKVASLAGEELFLSCMLPAITPLATDSVMDVRSKCAESCMSLLDAEAGLKLSEAVILEHLVPLLDKFLEDEFPEVQLNILRKLPSIFQLLGKTNKIVDSVTKMTEDSNWRIRQAVATILPYFAESLGVSQVSEELSELELSVFFLFKKILTQTYYSLRIAFSRLGNCY